MKNLLLLTLGCFVLLGACNEKATSGSSHPEFGLNESFELGIGKTMQLKGSDFTIKFGEVKQDSRCPEGVNCIVAGEVVFTLMGKEGTVEVKKAPKKEAKTSLDGYNLLIEAVNPYPKNAVQTDKNAYAVTMKVSK